MLTMLTDKLISASASYRYRLRIKREPKHRKATTTSRGPLHNGSQFAAIRSAHPHVLICMQPKIQLDLIPCNDCTENKYARTSPSRDRNTLTPVQLHTRTQKLYTWFSERHEALLLKLAQSRRR